MRSDDFPDDFPFSNSSLSMIDCVEVELRFKEMPKKSAMRLNTELFESFNPLFGHIHFGAFTRVASRYV